MAGYPKYTVETCIATPFVEILHYHMLQVAGGKVDGDDIHLIMEYKREEKWGTVPSPRANRLDHRSTRGRRSGALYPHLELTG